MGLGELEVEMEMGEGGCWGRGGCGWDGGGRVGVRWSLGESGGGG